MGTTYQDVVGAVGQYYGTDSDIWRKVFTSGAGGLTPEDIAALRQVPGVSVTVTPDGTFRGWDYNNPFPSQNNPLAGGNSNIPNSQYGGGSFNGRVNGTYKWDGTTQTGRLTSGAYKPGTGATVRTIAGKVNGAITAVSIGMMLGAKIDGALYNLGNFFNLHPPEELNPQTWDSLASSEGGKWLIRTLFDIDENGNGTMYMPEDMIDYMYKYWYELGLWNSGGTTTTINNVSGLTVGNIPVNPLLNNTIGFTVQTTLGRSFQITGIGDAGFKVIRIGNSSSYKLQTIFASKNPFTVTYLDNGTINTLTASQTTTLHRPGEPFYYTGFTYTGYNENSTNMNQAINPSYATGFNTGDIAYIIAYGNRTTSSPIDGAQPDPNATQPGTIDPTQPILPQLKQNMPNQFNDPVVEDVPQPNGTTKPITYYPVPIPNLGNPLEPVSGNPTQEDPIIRITDPVTETQPITDIIISPDPSTETPSPTPPETATPPDTGGGSSPPVVSPTGSASSLWAIYNPTQAQLDAFGSWLWSSNLVDQIKKLFNDPMQAIIGVHKVFVTPDTGSSENIKVGYLDSGCPAAKVTDQYKTINCGTVNVREYFGNVFDYSPYTEVQLYLPFIGVVKLDTADVMRGSVTVVYHVDVITGACLAEVKVNRDGESAVLYQYSGSAIVTYPVSSGSYASAVAGVLSLAAGVAGTIATGGAAAPALIGGAVGLSHIHANVQHSGSFSGSPGAMGGKKPYLIISRPQTAQPAEFEKYEGKPASKAVKLVNCSGFVKVKSINIDAVPATYGELDQIVSLLKNGVII